MSSPRADLQLHTLAAPALVDAHGALGRLVQGPARAAVERRLAAAAPERRDAELRAARDAWAALERRAGRSTVSAATRALLREYLDCLLAWTHGVGLDHDLRLDGARLLPEHLALWAQDDNTGCQTGALRLGDDLLLWHTEEDTLGGFDRARLVRFELPGGALTSFQYPYLLPGPAFGWSAGQLHAVDSLHVARTPGGAPTGVASWLAWRAGADAPLVELLRDLAPYVDGCVLVVARPTRAGVSAAAHAIGGAFVRTADLGKRRREFHQTNALQDPGPMAACERLDPDERGEYERRGQRARAWYRRLRARGRPGPQDILEMLADREGGDYANANADVVGHCVARLAPGGGDLHVGAGPVLAGDVFDPQWRLA